MSSNGIISVPSLMHPIDGDYGDLGSFSAADDLSTGTIETDMFDFVAKHGIIDQGGDDGMLQTKPPPLPPSTNSLKTSNHLPTTLPRRVSIDAIPGMDSPFNKMGGQQATSFNLPLKEVIITKHSGYRKRGAPDSVKIGGSMLPAKRKQVPFHFQRSLPQSNECMSFVGRGMPKKRKVVADGFVSFKESEFEGHPKMRNKLSDDSQSFYTSLHPGLAYSRGDGSLFNPSIEASENSFVINAAQHEIETNDGDDDEEGEWDVTTRARQLMDNPNVVAERIRLLQASLHQNQDE